MNLKRTLLPLAAGVCLAAGTFTASAHAAAAWHDGVGPNSTITNCSSIFQGNPYQEIGAKAWTGMWIDPDAPPKVGETFYVHTVMLTFGGHCRGPFGRPEISLPSGVTPAITAQDRIRCWGIDITANTAREDTDWCPAQPQRAFYGGQYAFGPTVTDPVAWPMPRGKGWEIWIPVKSDRPLKGMASNPVDQVTGAVKLFDGESSPVLNPTALLFTDATTGGGGNGGGGQPGPNPGNPDPGTQNPGNPDPGTQNPGGEVPIEQPAAPAPPTAATQPSAIGALVPLLRSASVSKSAKRSAIVSKGLPVSVTLGGTAAEVKAVLTGGGKTVATATRRNAKGTVKLTLKPSKRSARGLRRGRKAKVTITVMPKKGAASKTTRTVTIG